MKYVKGPRGHIYVLNALATIPYALTCARMRGTETPQIGGIPRGPKRGQNVTP